VKQLEVQAYIEVGKGFPESGALVSSYAGFVGNSHFGGNVV